MSNNTEELLEELKTKQADGTIESYERCLEIIDELLKHGTKKEEREMLLEDQKMINVEIIKIKLEALPEDSYQEKINIRGKLIKLYTELEKKAKKNDIKLQMRYLRLEAIKAQKEDLNNYRKQGDTKIPITKKVALNIQEISKTIQIFLEKKDVITKLKNILKATAASATSIALITGGIGLALQTVVGIPFSLATLVDAFPIIAYSGLSAIIKQMMTKTPFEQYQYQQSEEYKKLVEEFNENHQAEIEEIARIINKKAENNSFENNIEINNNLIKIMDSLSKETNIKGIEKVYELQALELFRDNKECCENIINDYLDGKNEDKEKYKKYKRELLRIKMEIFKRSNSLGDAIKDSGKGIAINAGAMAIARTIMSVIAPETFAIEGAMDFLLPFAYSIINGIIDIPTYNKKLKYNETEYEGKIKAKNIDRIEEILSTKRKDLRPVLA